MAFFLKKVEFIYRVAGNYLVFVSTDRQIPYGLKGKADPQTGKIDYDSISKSVGEIYDRGLAIGEYPIPGGASADLERRYSTTYFGQYIAQSPKFISVSDGELNNAFSKENREQKLYVNQATKQHYKGAYNYRSYHYEYALNVSSVTYGVNFKGDLAGVKFSGEVALNRSTNMLPGEAESKKTTWILINS